MLTTFPTNITVKQKMYIELFEQTLGWKKQEVVRRLIQIGIGRTLEMYHPVINREMSIPEWRAQKDNVSLEEVENQEEKEVPDKENQDKQPTKKKVKK